MAKKTVIKVSIPSSGSIQFLHKGYIHIAKKEYRSLNPLKRVNSILTELYAEIVYENDKLSQSPQAGQFNSYVIMNNLSSENEKTVSIPSSGSIQFLPVCKTDKQCIIQVSIPSSGSIQFLHHLCSLCIWDYRMVSIPSSGSIQFLPVYIVSALVLNAIKVSIPSSGSIQFLRIV